MSSVANRKQALYITNGGERLGVGFISILVHFYTDLPYWQFLVSLLAITRNPLISAIIVL